MRKLANQQRRDTVAEGEPLEHAREPEGVQPPRSGPYDLADPVAQQADTQQEERPSKDFPREGKAVPRERDIHGDSHDGQEGWEDKVGQEKTIPVGMPQDGKTGRPRSWIVHEDHQGDSQAPEDVQGFDTLDTHRDKDTKNPH